MTETPAPQDAPCSIQTALDKLFQRDTFATTDAAARDTASAPQVMFTTRRQPERSATRQD